MICEMEEQPREEEVVDGLPVLAADERVIEPVVATGVVPARQAAALAATTFVAGAATAAIVSRRRTKAPLRKRKKSKSAIGEIVGSNSFLVDVHLLRRD